MPETLSLFAPRAAAAPALMAPSQPKAPAIALRPYQVEAVAAIRSELEAMRSTLLVMATGLGKTTVFGHLATEWQGRVLVLAHRDELIQQAQKRLEAMSREYVDVEQADLWASGARIVVGSVQTISRPQRLERFRPDEFKLVIVDEAHHAPSTTYKRIIQHFADAKVLGVTATPDRKDRKALGQIFETVAYVYDVENGIGGGWLSPLAIHQVQVDTIDLSNVGTVAGDLNQGDLDAVMSVEENIHGVVKPCLELAGDRRTIVFTTSVEAAHRMAEVFNRYREGCARAVDGKTDREERRALLRDFEVDRFQFLVNVGIATEGFDSPGVACVAVARPTKSRALYAQMVGRGLRINPGKDNCLVLDFKGNSGKHDLASPLDILGGRWTDDEIALAEKLVAQQPGILAERALREARDQIEARKRAEEERRQVEAESRRRVRGKVAYRTTQVDPFKALGVRDPGEMWGDQFGWEPASEKQIDALKKFLGDEGVPANCSKQQAGRLMSTLIGRVKHGLSSFKQNKVIQRTQGIDYSQLKGLRHERAKAWIDAIKKNGWKPLPSEQVQTFLGRYRPGEEG